MLEQHRSAAMYAILGMMVASLYAIVMGPMTLEDPMPAMSVETFHVVWFIAGCAAVLGINLLKHWIDRKERKAELKIRKENVQPTSRFPFALNPISYNKK